jgi:hypothetical protein
MSMSMDVTSRLNRVEQTLADVLVTLVNVIVITEPQFKSNLISQLI